MQGNLSGMGGGRGMLSLTIRDKATLYAAYMPFIKDGGLFVPTDKEYKLGDEVFMVINLEDQKQRIATPGKVVWISPKGGEGGRPAGVGVQFTDGGTAAQKIEVLIPGAQDSPRPTHTM
jgi:type IV pilus assembly protein PilZ